MYRPPAFREDRRDVLEGAILAHPLGTLITSSGADLMANVVPFTLRHHSEGSVLQAHLARANDQVAHLRNGFATLVVFQGPQAYVSPSWYPTKQVHGKVVPTWNYVIVQVRGAPLVIDDPDWLRAQLDEMTAIHESGFAQPWSTNDAPADFIAGQMKGIVGVEIPIAQIEGKWKVSQNQPLSNQMGVEQGLRDNGNLNMADAVKAKLNSR